MVDRIKSETSLKELNIVKLSLTKYRVLIGPFNDIKSLKESFEKIKMLNETLIKDFLILVSVTNID